MAKAMPPKIAPKPGAVKVVRAMYNYTAQQEDELSFNEGDILYIQQEHDSDLEWWRARCGTKAGLIPSNYVELKLDFVENPIHDAARRGNLEFLQECLANGVAATGLDLSGNSPLHWAARTGHLDCVLALIEAGMNQFSTPIKFINTQNRLGESPLHMASAKDHLDIVNVLLENGADPRISNKDNQTALDLCHDPSVKSVLQNCLFHPIGNTDPAEDDYLQDSEED